MQLSNIANWRQRSEGECLAACVAMVLNNFSSPINYTQLLQRLETTEAGTPFSNLLRLNSWQLTAEIGYGQMTTVHQRLSKGNPLIIPVATELLPYWLLRPEHPQITEHALVVIGIDDQHVYANDPDFDEAPQVIDPGWFEEAWRCHNFRYAIIRRRRFRLADIKSYMLKFIRPCLR